MTTKVTRCLCCGGSITWEMQRRQYGRAIKTYGLTPDEAKTLMPRCGTCLTSLLGRHRRSPAAGDA